MRGAVYSLLSARMGSSREARRAGTQEAASSTAISVNRAVLKAIGSIGWIPINRLCKTIPTPSAMASPTAPPISASRAD